MKKVIEVLKEKACLKQKIYRHGFEKFGELKDQLLNVNSDLETAFADIDKQVVISYTEKGMLEAQLQFSGDVLTFSFHTNTFNFERGHFVYDLPYVRDDLHRSYCSMILIHNFLADSLKYNRIHDVGYLIGRIFINIDNHFFVEGAGKLGRRFKKFESQEFTPEAMRQIIETAILYSIDFDLLVPPFPQVNTISVQHKLQQEGNAAFTTAKRLGFKIEEED